MKKRDVKSSQKFDKDYWLALCPRLSITEQPAWKARVSPGGLIEADRVRQDLIEDGYSKIAQRGAVVSQEIVAQLNAGIVNLVRAGWPATFIIIYDEAWEAIEGMQTMIDAATHRKNRCIYDIVAWHVDAESGQAGFSPHRDRQPEDWMPRGLSRDVRSTFSSKIDGRVAKYNTVWLAVSEASAENSCLNFLPQRYDPGYLNGDLPDEDPMLRAFGVGKEVFQQIRSVPLPAGGCTFHTHRIIHWGSAAKAQRPGTERVPVAPRLAISCAFSDADFESPYLKRAEPEGQKRKKASFLVGGGLNLSIRLALAGAQVVNYADRWIEQLPAHVFANCHRLFAAQEEAFLETYRAEIKRKMTFLKSQLKTRAAKKAAKQRLSTAAATVTAAAAALSDDDDKGEDFLNRAMDDMLAAKLEMRGMDDDESENEDGFGLK